MVQLAFVGEETSIDLLFTIDGSYHSELKFTTNFRNATSFCNFEESDSLLSITPSPQDIGSYTLVINMSEGSNSHSKTMYLTVIDPAGIQDSPNSDTQANEQKEFTVVLHEIFTFTVDTHVRLSDGETFEAFELLGLTDFSVAEGRVITVMPTEESQLGEYPFFVRFTDPNGVS